MLPPVPVTSRREKGPSCLVRRAQAGAVLWADPGGASGPYAGVVLRDVVQSLWSEPRAAHAPRRVRRDWVLIGAVLISASLETVLRSDVVWQPVAVLLVLVLAASLPVRRTHPLGMVAIVFGSIIVADVVGLFTSAGPIGLYTMVFVLVLAYALARWGAGREVVIGLAIMIVAAILGVALEFTGVVDAVVAFVVLLLPVLAGLAVRYWASSRARELDQVKLRERAQLARELHDSVGHHVSAIAIRAQAGRVLAPTDPAAALDALEVIEQEASRALAEMRTVVASLRDGEAAALTPLPGVADLATLADSVGDPQVHLALSGDLDNLSAGVDSAIYRIVQESVTNAVRHGRRATRIDVRVTGEPHQVRLVVRDDGEPGVGPAVPVGYGLVGMAERATLLGGTLDAGPSASRGWTVQAVLPKVGSTR